MANEEIEISELEFTEELASDNLIPVESSTDTKATSLQILKNWLTSFFIKKSGDTMTGLLDTMSYFRMRGGTTRIIEVNSLDNSQTWGTFEVYKDSDTAAHTAIFAFNPSDNSKNAIVSIYINGDEKWAQCPASKRNNSIVTTEYHGSRYVRFGNGLQICWGAGTNVQTLPQPFRDNDYQITDSDLSYHKYEGMWISDKTTTQFKINNTSMANWVAIGYWY